MLEGPAAILQHFFNLNCVSISFLALLIYDYLCTLGDEAEYVWKSRWSIGLPLFYLNRYLVFIDQPLLFRFSTMTDKTEALCAIYFKFSVWLLVIGGNITSFIIYLQTCAIWGNNKKVIIPLGVLQVGKTIAGLIMVHLQWGNASYPVLNFVGGVCGIDSPHNYARYSYLTMGLVEAVTIACTFVKAIHHLKNSNSSWVSQLYKNGILYCTCILMLCLANIVVPELPSSIRSPIYKGILTRPQRVMESILCNRVMFVIFQYRKRSEQHLQNGQLRHPDEATAEGDTWDYGEGSASVDIFTSVLMSTGNLPTLDGELANTQCNGNEEEEYTHKEEIREVQRSLGSSNFGTAVVVADVEMGKLSQPVTNVGSDSSRVVNSAS